MQLVSELLISGSLSPRIGLPFRRCLLIVCIHQNGFSVFQFNLTSAYHARKISISHNNCESPEPIGLGSFRVEQPSRRAVHCDRRQLSKNPGCNLADRFELP